MGDTLTGALGDSCSAACDVPLTGLLRQLHGLSLLVGGHLVEAQVLLGVLKAVEVDTLAVDHHVRQLFGQLQLLLLLPLNEEAVKFSKSTESTERFKSP